MLTQSSLVALPNGNAAKSLSYQNNCPRLQVFSSRVLSGAADAAAMGAMLAILMKLYPGKTGSIVAWTGTASGVGHMAGNVPKVILF